MVISRTIQSIAGSMTTEEGRASTEELCPYCGGPLQSLSCSKCGIICSRCGTPNSEDACRECDGDSLSWSARESPHGGGAAPTDLHRIVRAGPEGGYLSSRERTMLRGTFIDGRQKTIHDKAVRGCERINVSHELRSVLIERVERAAALLVRNGTSVEDAVAFSVLSQARPLGLKLWTIQNALALAGFRVRLNSMSLSVVAEDPGKLLLCVNGEARKMRVAASDDVRLLNVIRAFNLRRFSGYSIRVQVQLIDALDHGRMRLTLAGGYFADRGVLTSETTFALSVSKCFSLFKTEKMITVDVGEAVPELNLDVYIRSFTPSKRFPISAEILRDANRLTEFERAVREIFVAKMGSSRGRSPHTIAREVLFEADRAIFKRCTGAERLKAYVAARQLRLSEKRDVCYTGIEGFLIPSEVASALDRGATGE